MTTQAVLAALDDYARTYCAKDIAGLMAVFDTGEHISVIGTGPDEICGGRDRVEELFLRNFGEASAHRSYPQGEQRNTTTRRKRPGVVLFRALSRVLVSTSQDIRSVPSQIAAASIPSGQRIRDRFHIDCGKCLRSVRRFECRS